jgi:hydroxyethylthiazole kinase-like uncharacterized protein yjeF
VFVADVTVTFGTPKPGLLLMPAHEYVGALEVVDIGLGPFLPPSAALEVLDRVQVAALLPAPGPADHKYSRGVVGVAAGSRRYRGAAALCVGGARRGGTGMVAFLSRDGDLAGEVVGRYPDVIVATVPGEDPRVTAWVVGPGLGRSAADVDTVLAVLATSTPVLLDADALGLLAAEPAVREALARRSDGGGVTVLTPHEGEFARLGYPVGQGADADRVAAARSAAADLGTVLLLKGATTVVAEPAGRAWVNLVASPDLATAGSGDVLSGLAGSMLARQQAHDPLGPVAAARVAAAAAWVHGLSGRLAGSQGRPVAAFDLVEALPAAISLLRPSGG